MTTCDRVLRGKYGQVIRRGRIPYVELAAVHGIKFTEEQLALAVDGRADRLLVIPDHQEEDDASGIGSDTAAV